MIQPKQLLKDLSSLIRSLEADLLERSAFAPLPEVRQALQAEYHKAQAAERTAQSYETWRSDYITQVAGAWVLSCVFTRFLEDNQLIDPPTISGPGERLIRARDEHELYFRAHPTETDREYLLQTFRTLATLPGANDIFGQHNPIHELPNWLSGDSAGALLAFFQRINAETGALVHDFTDEDWDTRFLGDLYQNLSEAARKKYALLQTPEFVEEFILDRTLEPALEEFGLVVRGQLSVVSDQSSGGGQGTDNYELTTDNFFKMIDPACGSGHFLLGSFARLLDRWQRKEPGTNVRVLAQRALDGVHGVDVNPYAVAIARFRLLLMAMKESGIRRMVDAPAFQIHVACGDSLIHGSGAAVQQMLDGSNPIEHVYQNEDLPKLRSLLQPGTYHAVVANPPYITVKDKALNDAYRGRYPACHRQYSLSVPFMQRIFNLAVIGGFTGQITANSFMKREFGKKLIEEFLPRVDLTHVIDTSGAYIPGHGTPTVILFGRYRAPISREVRAVLGVRGEPSTPDNAARGEVWLSIVSNLDQNGWANEFVSVTDSPREGFSKHPWSIGGGGANELKKQIDSAGSIVIGTLAGSVGRTCSTQGDDVFLLPMEAGKRIRLPDPHVRLIVIGEDVRDWSIANGDAVAFPYDAELSPIEQKDAPDLIRYLWPTRSILANTKMFGNKTKVEIGLRWYEYGQFIAHKLRTPLSIAFAFVATHNHFVLDRGGKVFNRSAPIIKLPSTATEDDHLALLGLLNSSTACFWMKQVFFPKGGDKVGSEGARIRKTWWDERYEFAGTQMQAFPLTSEKPFDLAITLDGLAQEWQKELPPQLSTSFPLSQDLLNTHQSNLQTLLGRMIALQEELDWQCYRLYNLLDTDLTYDKEPPPIQLGQRAFEIVMARKMAAGELETTWFERHGSTPITEIPTEWPDDYKQLIERRIELIQTDRNIGLIEQPEYKRRWNTESWESQLERALRSWLLNRLETYFDFDGRMNDAGTPTATLEIGLISMAQLADAARQDADFMQVAALYRDDPAFEVLKLVSDLVEAESVPLLPVLRYKAAGLRKRVEWEQTWELQREEDIRSNQSSVLSDQLSESSSSETDNYQLITDNSPPVPPKYTSGDFTHTTYWRLRGKLDVPKERWVSFPHCEGPDGTLMLAWAGYDHLQLARVISAYYVDVQERFGGRDDPRLTPLLGCLIELLPWLKQWHNDVDPEFGMHMGDYFEGFVQEEARQMGKTLDEIKDWQVPKKVKRLKRSKP